MCILLTAAVTATEEDQNNTAPRLERSMSVYEMFRRVNKYCDKYILINVI